MTVGETTFGPTPLQRPPRSARRCLAASGYIGRGAQLAGAAAACAALTSTLTCSVSSALISLNAGVVFTE